MEIAAFSFTAMSVTITDDMVGKDVVDITGTKVGIVTSVRQGTAYVDPDPGITDELKAKLGWEDVDEEDYPLQVASIESVTDDEVRLELP